MPVTFESNVIEVSEKMSALAFSALEECAAEMESQVKRNTAVDTGQTKNSWRHKITGSLMAGQYLAVIGSDYENAIWEEYGTGEYALNGDGRKGGWWYQDPKWGVWIHTKGKHPRRAFFKAYAALKNPIIARIQAIFGGL